jgi:acetolactate decarboxylase
MKRLLLLAAGILIGLSGCIAPESNPPRDTVFQTSTIDTLLAGVFDGNMPCGDLKSHGDFGIGTFDRLDGEMVVLDGCVFQIKADGKVYKPAPEITTPFATVCSFNPDTVFNIEQSSDYNTVEKLINEKIPNHNIFYAIKITGQFKSVKTRSVPRQNKPYPPLKEITPTQPEFNMKDVNGVIVGFRCPAYVKGINVSGYHLHFLNADRTQGGHVLSFELTRGKCEIDNINQFSLRLPADINAFSSTDLTKDRSIELKNVEKAGAVTVKQ